MAGGIAGAPRIARHLWRMCLGLVMATGSAFTNGFARFLPGPYHVPMVFFLPQVLPLALLIFWMIRVRLTGWAKGRMMLRPA
jgi:ATP adenylyltransferase/5',5'''-P-1,P-4-tetraphosphate phosphorylase II